MNYRIVRFFIEPGITGKNDRRPEFKEMRSGIKKGLFKFVIAKEISRISRDEVIWNSFLESCISQDCEIIIRGLRLNPRDPVQKHILNQLAGFASLESGINKKRQMESNHTRLTISKKLNSTHLILGLDQLVENGKPVVGKFQINRDEAKLSKWIF